MYERTNHQTEGSLIKASGFDKSAQRAHKAQRSKPELKMIRLWSVRIQKHRVCSYVSSNELYWSVHGKIKFYKNYTKIRMNNSYVEGFDNDVITETINMLCGVSNYQCRIFFA